MAGVINEEINEYIKRIENVSISEVESVLPNASVYNFDVIINRICDGLSENINILRRLNNENGEHVLDDEINELLKKYYICNNYLNILNDSMRQTKYNGNKVIFAKTPAGNPYFKLDLDKIPKELYGDVLKTLGYIINGVDRSDKRKVRFYTNNNLSQRIIEFKGFQARIFTTKLKGNVLCIIGLVIKKANDRDVIKDNLKTRLSKAQQQIEEYRLMMNDPVQKRELLEANQKILDEIMQVLGENSLDDDIEFLFPDEVELAKLVPYTEEDLPETTLEDIDKGFDLAESSEDEMVKKDESSTNLTVDIPKTSKKVKKRTRGLGKKTIVRNKIVSSIKEFNLEELMKVQNFITKLKMNKELNDSIGTMYAGFKGMSDEQVRKFEESIKYFKYDDVGRHK